MSIKLSHLNRNHFEIIADNLKCMQEDIPPKAYRELVEANIEHLKKTNTLFKPDTFREACGI